MDAREALCQLNSSPAAGFLIPSSSRTLNVHISIRSLLKHFVYHVPWVLPAVVPSLNRKVTCTFVLVYYSHTALLGPISVFVFCDHCHKLTQTWWLKTTAIYHLNVLEARS